MLLSATPIGPFNQAQRVELTATGTALSYDVATAVGAVSVTPSGTEPNAITGGQLATFDSAFASPSVLRNTRKAMALYRNGIANMRIAAIGDSVTAGYNELFLANELAYSWVAKLAANLTAGGMPSVHQNWMGDHSLPDAGSTIQIGDTRVGAYTGGWSTFGPSEPGPCGLLLINNTNTNRLTFTPSIPTSAADLYYFDGAGYDTINILTGVAGATAPSSGGSVVPAGSGTWKRLTAVAPSLINNVWTFAKSNAGNNFIFGGFSAYDNSKPQIDLLNFGCHQKTFSYFADTAQPWRPLASLTTAGSALICPLAIICLGINDALAGRSTAAVSADLAKIIPSLQAVGTDVILVVPPPSPISVVSQPAQDAVTAAIVAAASTYGLPLLDMTYRWTSQAISQPLGFYAGAADVHPSQQGHTDLASAVASLLRSI